MGSLVLSAFYQHLSGFGRTSFSERVVSQSLPIDHIPAYIRHRRRRRGRQESRALSFHFFKLTKPHVLSISIGLGLIILLLVIFANHGGYGLFVVSVGLAFIVFGPLLVCKILMHAYYRQIQFDGRLTRFQVENQTQTIDTQPQVYACIIITPRQETAPRGPRSFENSIQINFSDLPSYDDAVNNDYSSNLHNNTVIPNTSEICLTPNFASVSDTIPHYSDRQETPPPSYNDALAVLTGGAEERDTLLDQPSGHSTNP